MTSHFRNPLAPTARTIQLRVGLVACAAVVGLAVFSVSALAAEPPQGKDASGRYTMQPTDGGFLRLDTSTGILSFCRTKSGAWSCDAVADERLVLEDELKRLRTENDDLKSTVRKLEDIAGLPSDKELEKKGTGPNSGPSSGSGGFKLPSEEDVDKAMSYVERMLKKFKDKLKDLEAESGKKGTQL
ncbi:MAG: hypothetical protein ABL898_10945 [Hyphomicrobiaceae bacterium]|nr:hypothetical protein [Hyphomicrobiaceae bacterium]